MGEAKRRKGDTTTITLAGQVAGSVEIGDQVRIFTGDGRSSSHRVKAVTSSTITIGRTWLDKLILWTAIVFGVGLTLAAAYYFLG